MFEELMQGHPSENVPRETAKAAKLPSVESAPLRSGVDASGRHTTTPAASAANIADALPDRLAARERVDVEVAVDQRDRDDDADDRDECERRERRCERSPGLAVHAGTSREHAAGRTWKSVDVRQQRSARALAQAQERLLRRGVVARLWRHGPLRRRLRIHRRRRGVRRRRVRRRRVRGRRRLDVAVAVGTDTRASDRPKRRSRPRSPGSRSSSA